MYDLLPDNGLPKSPFKSIARMLGLASKFHRANAANLTPVGETEFDIRAVVGAIMSAQNWILERLPPDQKLVIILAEEHNDQLLMLFHQAVIRAFAKQRDTHPERQFAFGIEADHNVFQRNRLSYTIADVEKNLRLLCDPALVKKGVDAEASLAIFKMCQTLGISVGLNDIASKKAPENSTRLADIDQTDPLTKDLVQRYKPEYLGKEIPRAVFTEQKEIPHAEGIRLSNLAIVDNAILHMERTGARIYLQHCGWLHSLGYKKTSESAEYEFGDSLCARFAERGMTVLPVMAWAKKWQRDIPDKAIPIWRDSIRTNLSPMPRTEHPYPAVRDAVNLQSNLELT